MKKLTQKQLLDLAAAIGLEGVELVEDEAQSEFNLDTALSLVDGNRRNILEPMLRQELEPQIKTASDGKMLGAIRSMLVRTTGLSHSKLKEFSDDKIEDMFKAAIQHKVSSVEGNAEETTKKFDELVQAHNEAMNKANQEWEGKYNELNTKYVSRDIKEALRGALKDAPLLQTADKDIAAGDFMKHLQDKYHLNFDEAKKMVALMDKSNPAIPALNEAKNAQIDILGEAKSFFEPRGLWVKDMRHVNPADAMGGQGVNPNLPKSTMPHGPKTPEQLRQERIASYETTNNGGL